MNQENDWDATREFEEMEEMDELDGGKNRSGRKGVSILTIVSSAIAAAAIVLCGFMLYNSTGAGKAASVISEAELSEALTAETENAEMTVVGLGDTMTVSSGGATMGSADQYDEDDEDDEDVLDGTDEGLIFDDTDDAYVIANSDSRYLTSSDLFGLSADELRLARNEIYARHGYIFKDPDLQAYFEGKSWYTGTIPHDSFDESVFNDYEKTNITLIKSFE